MEKEIEVVEVVETGVARIPRRQRGITTVEYAIAGGLIAAVVVGAFFALGGKVTTVIQAITTALGFQG